MHCRRQLGATVHFQSGSAVPPPVGVYAHYHAHFTHCKPQLPAGSALPGNSGVHRHCSIPSKFTIIAQVWRAPKSGSCGIEYRTGVLDQWTLKAEASVVHLGDLSLKCNTKENFKDRFPILEWMKFLKCSQILRWNCYIFGWMYLIWMNKCYFIYLQNSLSKFVDVNSYVAPLKIATCDA